MIKSEFTFFQVKIKSAFMDSFELGESSFCNTPEALDAVDVAFAKLYERACADFFIHTVLPSILHKNPPLLSYYIALHSFWY